MGTTCINHPDRNTKSVCHACGQPYCAECLKEGTEYYYCRSADCQPTLQAELVAYVKSVPKGLARPWGRFANLVIDLGLVYGLYIVSSLALQRSTGDPVLFSQAIDWYLLAFAYYFLFEGAFQRTPGKFVTSTRVMSRDGTGPSICQIFVRTLSRFVPFEALSWLFSEHDLWWHDRWSKTIVGYGASVNKNDT